MGHITRAPEPAAHDDVTPPVLLDVRGLRVEVTQAESLISLVDDVSFTVAAGETVGLVGESGSGKTVTSLAVMQLLPRAAVLSGSVRLHGQELVGRPRRELDRLRGSQLSMIFQEARRSLNPVFTVGSQISESIRRHKGVSRTDAWARTVELLDLVRIPDAGRRAQQYPHELSGGMCQRVMLAMALACEPDLLIADEPTTALDVTVQREVLSLIKEAQLEFGLGLLLITHDLGVVAEVCDRAIVMYAGRVVESAPVMDLFDRPQHPYTAGLEHSMPDPVRHASKLGTIPGTVPPAPDFTDSCRFAPRCPYELPECTMGPIPIETTAPLHDVRCIRAGTLDLSEAFYA